MEFSPSSPCCSAGVHILEVHLPIHDVMSSFRGETETLKSIVVFKNYPHARASREVFNIQDEQFDI